MNIGIAECACHTDCSNGHTERTDDKQRLATEFLYGEDGNTSESEVDDTVENGEHHRIVEALLR